MPDPRCARCDAPLGTEPLARCPGCGFDAALDQRVEHAWPELLRTVGWVKRPAGIPRIRAHLDHRDGTVELALWVDLADPPEHPRLRQLGRWSCVLFPLLCLVWIISSRHDEQWTPKLVALGLALGYCALRRGPLHGRTGRVKLGSRTIVVDDRPPIEVGSLARVFVVDRESHAELWCERHDGTTRLLLGEIGGGDAARGLEALVSRATKLASGPAHVDVARLPASRVASDRVGCVAEIVTSSALTIAGLFAVLAWGPTLATTLVGDNPKELELRVAGLSAISFASEVTFSEPVGHIGGLGRPLDYHVVLTHESGERTEIRCDALEPGRGTVWGTSRERDNQGYRTKLGVYWVLPSCRVERPRPGRYTMSVQRAWRRAHAPIERTRIVVIGWRAPFDGPRDRVVAE